jgi:hypothetical protein
MAPALPPRLVPPTEDPAVLAEHRAGLAAAERSFSDEAQRIGLGPAFARWGSADAVNMGGPDSPEFVVGAEAIGRAVAGPDPVPGSPLSWSSDDVLVASSGDLGVSIGWLRPNQRASDGSTPQPIPFFTVWRRAGPGEPWRYVAE